MGYITLLVIGQLYVRIVQNLHILDNLGQVIGHKKSPFGFRGNQTEEYVHYILLL